MTNSSNQWPEHAEDNQAKSFFTVEKGFAYAGRHLLFDCWNASELNNIELIEQTMHDVVTAIGGKLLDIRLHRFTPKGGVSGLVIMGSSHISIHTWPERDYAALDVLMCGDADPERALPIFKRAFRTENIDVSEHLRGRQFNDLTPHSTKDLLEQSELQRSEL